MTLSQYLYEYRNSHGLSQRAFSAMCGLSNSYISLLEKNVNPSTGEPIVPNLHSLNKIAKAMGITVEELFAACDDMPVSIDMPAEQSVTPVTEDEQLLLDLFRTVPEQDRALVLQMIRAALASKGLL